jgi:LPXTG-motif cell wall-anchored protein
MDNTTILIVVVGLAVLLGLVALLVQTRRRKALQDRFGPEYERTVEERGGRRKAEAELQDRARRVEAFAIKPLRPGDRERYIRSWTQVQADFVDNPKVAVGRADELLSEIMAARGYPVGDFEQRSADLSVDHPVVVQNYRAGHEIAMRQAGGRAGTEDLRQAMIHYRALFEDLVSDAEPVARARAS